MEDNQRLELKILVLREELATRDDRIADLRVIGHDLTQQLQNKELEVQSLTQQLEEAKGVQEEDSEEKSADEAN